MNRLCVVFSGCIGSSSFIGCYEFLEFRVPVTSPIVNAVC